jgi:hypothetical protein
MHSVILDSPREVNRKCKSWPNNDGTPAWTASCISFIGPFDGPILGGETLTQLTTSWCIPSEVLLAWRMLMFLYFSGTCMYLGHRGALVVYALSAEIYIFQTIASILILVPCFLTKRGSGMGCFSGRNLSHRNSSFGLRRHSPSPEESGREWCCSSARQTLLTTAIVVLQSVAALVFFWDTVFWRRLRLQTESTLDVLLLQSYNAMPLAVELLFGNTEFALLYFLPSLLFIGTYLGMTARGKSIAAIAGKAAQPEEDWARQLFLGSISPAAEWGRLMALYLLVCAAVFFMQRLRRSIGHCVSNEVSNTGRVGRVRRSRSSDKFGRTISDRDDSPPGA